MRDLSAYANQCIATLNNLNIPIGTVDRWVVNSRAKRWGMCRLLYNRNDERHYEIQINQDLLKEANSEAGLKNTIIHELLHTVKGGGGHTKAWAHYAAIVNRELHMNIKRCSSSEDKGVVDAKPRNVKYSFTCEKCGRVLTYERRCAFVDRYQRYTHTGCGGHFIKNNI